MCQGNWNINDLFLANYVQKLTPYLRGIDLSPTQYANHLHGKMNPKCYTQKPKLREIELSAHFPH